jgi:hypothetical protein
MIAVLFSWSFWIPTLGILAVIATLALWVGRIWSTGNAVTLNWNAFAAPLNTAITVAGIVLPLIASLVAYSTGNLGKTYSDLNLLFVSAALFLLTLLIGLWTAVGLATVVTNKDGVFTVDATSNTFYPAFLVAQLALLFSGFAVLLVHVASGLPLDQTAPDKTQLSRHVVLVVRTYPSTGMSPEQVRAMLGAPTTEAQTQTRQTLTYLTHNAELRLVIEDGAVVEMTETKRSTK